MGKVGHLLVVGLVRNAAKTLPREFEKMNDLRREFKSISWFFVESDSTDTTVNVLEQIRSSCTNFDYISLGKLETEIPNRIERIAHCRNQYLDYLRVKIGVGSDIYMLVADLDGLNQLYDCNAIMRCVDSEYDVLTANQSGPYYDIYALRAKSWSEGDCWQQFNELVAAGIESKAAYQLAVGSKMIRVPSNTGIIEVESAFGGLAVYRTSAISTARYSAFDADGNLVCEHVPFHQGIIEAGGSIGIAPWFINCSYNEHTYWRHPLRRAVQPLFTAGRLAITALLGADSADHAYKTLRRYLKL